MTDILNDIKVKVMIWPRKVKVGSNIALSLRQWKNIAIAYLKK